MSNAEDINEMALPDNDNMVQENATAPKTPEKAAAKHIPLHEIIVEQMSLSDFSLPMESEEQFCKLVQAIVDDLNATTLSQQEIALDRARKIFMGWRIDAFKRRLIESEMFAAAVATYKRTLDTGLPRGALDDAKALQLAKKAHLDNGVFDQDQLEFDGYGSFPIETGAMRLALRSLEQAERLSTANQRAKNLTLKEYRALELLASEKGNDGE